MQIPAVVVAQGKLADYQRAERMNTLIQNKIEEAPANVRWLKEKHCYFYSYTLGEEIKYMFLNSTDYAISEAFNEKKMKVALNKISTEKNALISNVNIDERGENVNFTSLGKIYTYNILSSTCTLLRSLDQNPAPYWGNQMGINLIEK